MRKLNKSATKTFEDIIEKLNGADHITIDNSSFMPLSVEKLYTTDIGTFYSFCHYFKQNGDMCQDPEMLFIKHKNGAVYPAMFQQAIPPIYQESIFMEHGKWQVRTSWQKQHTSFANMWLKNIKYQQLR